MTYILLIAFVWGVSKVISMTADFFGFDIDGFYHYKSDYLKRSEWQQFIMKPTIYCNVCMSSFWGTICYWLLLSGNSWQDWILHCVICAGAIWIINVLIEAIEI